MSKLQNSLSVLETENKRGLILKEYLQCSESCNSHPSTQGEARHTMDQRFVSAITMLTETLILGSSIEASKSICSIMLTKIGRSPSLGGLGIAVGGILGTRVAGEFIIPKLQEMAKTSDSLIFHLAGSIGLTALVYFCQKNWFLPHGLSNLPLTVPNMQVSVQGDIAIREGSALIHNHFGSTSLQNSIMGGIFAHMMAGALSILGMKIIGLAASQIVLYGHMEEWKGVLSEVSFTLGGGIGAYASTALTMPYCYQSLVSCAAITLPIIATSSALNIAFEPKYPAEQVMLESGLKKYLDIPRDICLHTCLIESFTNSMVSDSIKEIDRGESQTGAQSAAKALEVNNLLIMQTLKQENLEITSSNKALDFYNVLQIEMCNVTPQKTHPEDSEDVASVK